MLSEFSPPSTPSFRQEATRHLTLCPSDWLEFSPPRYPRDAQSKDLERIGGDFSRALRRVNAEVQQAAIEAKATPEASNETAPESAARDASGLPPKDALDQLAEGVRFAVAEAASFPGPLPPPATLKAYEQAHPGLAERIVLLAKDEQNQRTGWEDRAHRPIHQEHREKSAACVCACVRAGSGRCGTRLFRVTVGCCSAGCRRRIPRCRQRPSKASNRTTSVKGSRNGSVRRSSVPRGGTAGTGLPGTAAIVSPSRRGPDRWHRGRAYGTPASDPHARGGRTSDSELSLVRGGTPVATREWR